jgi:hypothetical protein
MLDEQIRQAIAERRVVGFRYNGQRRMGELHLYGKSKGQPTVLLYMTGGSFMGGPYPTWRRCDISAITRFGLLTVTFSQPRLNPNDSFSEWDEIWEMVK